MRAPLTRRDHGSATAEFILVLPIVMLAMLIAIQAALIWVADRALLAAADEGARTARADGGSASAGRTRALGVLTQIAPGLVHEPRASAARSATTARVTVTGLPVHVVPWLTIRLTATASSPVERPS